MIPSLRMIQVRWIASYMPVHDHGIPGRGEDYWLATSVGLQRPDFSNMQAAIKGK